MLQTGKTFQKMSCIVSLSNWTLNCLYHKVSDLMSMKHIPVYS